MISQEEWRQAWRHRHRHLSEPQAQLRRVAFRWVRAGYGATDARLANGMGLPLKIVRDELTTLSVSMSTIGRIMQGLAWSHLTGITPPAQAPAPDAPHPDDALVWQHWPGGRPLPPGEGQAG